MSSIPSLKKSQDKVLLLNVTEGTTNKGVISDQLSYDKDKEIDGRREFPYSALQSIEDGLVSGLVNKGMSVLGPKLDLSYTVASNTVGAATDEFIYPSHLTIDAMKKLKERYQFNKILTYRILALKVPEADSNSSVSDKTRIRMHVRVIDADSGIVLYSTIIDQEMNKGNEVKGNSTDRDESGKKTAEEQFKELEWMPKTR